MEMRNMNKNIIEFYKNAINLKNVDRTGWKEVGVSNVESVMDHIGGTLLLAITIASEKGLDLDMKKVYEMIAVKEIRKINKEESVINGSDYNDEGKSVLPSSLVGIYDEYIKGESEEAKFALMVSKLESDFQAKKYELDGEFTLENAKEDIKNYPEELQSKLGDITKASEGWLNYDRQYYDELFMSLSKDIEEL